MPVFKILAIFPSNLTGLTGTVVTLSDIWARGTMKQCFPQGLILLSTFTTLGEGGYYGLCVLNIYQ